MTFTVARTIGDLRTRIRDWRRAGNSVSLVPTMGSLHKGHLSLVHAAKKRTDRVIVSIFVNPAQFNDPTDFTSYPKSETTDVKLLKEAGVDLLFAPDVDVMYPDDFATSVSVSKISNGLCGASRPGHFDGVATIVAKLFFQAGADYAFFGEKDYQQLQVIRKMVRDLNIPISIIGCETIRESDQLAMSSRNIHLSVEQRKIAPSLIAILRKTGQEIEAGMPVNAALDKARIAVDQAGFTSLEYIELRAQDTLRPMSRLNGCGRLLAAVYLAKTRLIDNIAVAAGY